MYQARRIARKPTTSPAIRTAPTNSGLPYPEVTRSSAHKDQQGGLHRQDCGAHDVPSGEGTLAGAVGGVNVHPSRSRPSSTANACSFAVAQHLHRARWEQSLRRAALSDTARSRASRLARCASHSGDGVRPSLVTGTAQ